MGFFQRLSTGLSQSRDKFKESMNVLLKRGPMLDEEFWDTLEETLILSDVGGLAANDIVENLRDQATRQALPDAYSVLDLLNDQITATFTPGGSEIFGSDEAIVLFVGINGTGKTTTVGKIAKEYTDQGRKVILGSADTFRAAAIEQLEVWADRARVEIVKRERGADPASVCYDTIERAEKCGADLVLIDTAGRLHTSDDLMRELEKVVGVVRKRAKLPVYTVLVIDATTGQNGLQQAREFNRALNLDALVVTKLDGTAKGGIALAVSHELELPIIKIGVGEGIEDLRDFNAHDFASALIGDFDERSGEDEAESEIDVIAEEEPESEIDVIAEEEPESEQESEFTEVPEVSEYSDVEVESEAESESESEAESESEVERKVETEEEPKAELKSEPEPESESETEPGLEGASVESKSETEPGLEGASVESESETERNAGADTDTENIQNSNGDNPEEKSSRKKHFWERWF